MFVKKFEAESIEQGLREIRKELGPDALILGTQKKKNGLLGKSVVEITAAFEKKEEPKTSGLDVDLLSKVFPHRKGSEPQLDQKNRRYIDIEDGQQKRILTSPKKNRFESDFIRLGISSGGARELANKLICDYPEGLSDPEEVNKNKKRILGASFKCVSLPSLMERKSIAFIGTAGSGKTTGLVKLALNLRQNSRSVYFSSFDTRKIVSSIEMNQYSRALRIPLKNPEENVGTGIQLIDTPSLKLDAQDSNWAQVKKLEKIKASVFLCLEGTLRLPEMFRIVECAQSLYQVEGLWITKLDLVAQAGFLYDLLRQVKLPVCAISLSQSLQDQIQFADPNTLSQLILRRGEAL